MNLTKVMMKRDDIEMSILYKTWFFLHSLNLKSFSTRRKMNALPPEGIDKDLFIILNGPSLKTQDLSKLKGCNLMFVNRGFKHPLYQELQPKYHVFVDSKLRDGEWPIEWLDDIFKVCPSIKILMPIEWYTYPRFERFQNDNRIIWLTWHVPFYSIGVSESCFSFAIKNKFRNIYFTGFDANGIIHEMIEHGKSHFYGEDAELTGLTTEQYAQGLFAHSHHLHDLFRLSEYCKKHNVSIYNLTNGGILDMFPRKDFDEVCSKL